jgi:hypothetical protein
VALTTTLLLQVATTLALVSLAFVAEHRREEGGEGEGGSAAQHPTPCAGEVPRYQVEA